jgi:hypothetical protein
MTDRHSISIWFFIGTLLLIYGVAIFISNIFEAISPSQQHTVVLKELNFGIWWGLLLIVIGAVYFIAFRPWKKKAEIK